MPAAATHRHRTMLSAAVAVSLVLAGSASGSPRRTSPRKPPAGPAVCPDAGRAEVAVPAGVDGIRVFATDGHPDAATDVTLLAAGRHRTVRAFGGGVFGLQLDKPLRALRIQVALEPVLDAPSGVCVSRVELLRGGTVVATVF